MALQFASALDNARLFAEVKEAYESLQRAQDQLVHAEKFAAVGLLAAEIAHEINNPASFVISNLSVMLEYTETIVEFLDELEGRLRDGVEDGAEPLTAEGFEAMRQTYDIGYLKEDMDALLSRSLNGMQRIHQIVQDLRYLSRDSGEEAGWLDLQSLLDATVNLVSHEAKFRADIVLEYGDVPQIMSDASRLSQVFLNLMVNAVQAIEDDNVQENEIKVQTRMADEKEGIVEVVISDTGKGIPEEAQDRIFDAFFTTKETGEGTGLGLSISQDIIRSLGGSIDFETERGVGTTFYVRLPIRAEKFQEDENLRDSGYYDSPPELDRVPDDLFEQS
jgi:two-component system NtrC family sensor kinase